MNGMGKGKGMNEFWTNTNLEPWRLDGPRIFRTVCDRFGARKERFKRKLCYLLFAVFSPKCFDF